MLTKKAKKKEILNKNENFLSFECIDYTIFNAKYYYI